MNAICLTHLSVPLQHSPKTVLFNLRLSTSFRLRHRFSTPSAPPVHSISLPIRSISPISAVGGGSGDGDGEGGGGFGGNSGGGDSGEDNEEVDPKDTGKGGMSMSQKLTLVYAALVGAGGVIGYVKSGSTKSAISGGLSALILYIVYILLPVKPVLASFLGVGISVPNMDFTDDTELDKSDFDMDDFTYSMSSTYSAMSPPNCKILSPYVGQSFQDLELGRIFYYNYADNMGFDMRRALSHKIQSQLSTEKFVCSKEGESKYWFGLRDRLHACRSYIVHCRKLNC